jgi:hypothetical protein
MELKLITAALIPSYEIELSPSATRDRMTMVDHFLVLPNSGMCELIFSSVAKVSKEVWSVK